MLVREESEPKNSLVIGYERGSDGRRNRECLALTFALPAFDVAAPLARRVDVIIL